MRALSLSLVTFLALAWGNTYSQNVHLNISPDKSSPHEALRQARELRRLHKVGDNDTLFIHFADGIYRLSETLFLRPEDSGTPTSPTILLADNPGKAILSGGIELKDTEQEYDGCQYFEPKVNNRTITVRQLWKNDKKVPHSSLVPLDKMLPILDFSAQRREISIAKSDFEPFINEGSAHMDGLDELEMIVHQRWAIAILRVKDYRISGDTVHLSFFDPESRLEFEHPWPQPVINEDRGDGQLVSSSYNLLGAIQCAQPGTWFQSLTNGVITYCGDDDATFTAPNLHTLVEVSGSLERPVHDIIFRGLSFQHAAWTRPSTLGHVTLQGGMYLLDAYKLQIPGLPEKEYLENQAWIERPEAAVSVRGGRHIDFDQCEFRHLGATGLDYVWADSACKVTQCRFEDIGGTALALGAFPDRGFETHVPFRPVNMSELCQDFLIEGNVIRDVTNEDWGCVGIGAGYVADVMIRNNELSELNYSGICVGWGWTPLNSGMRNNHIIGNHVHHFARMLYDAGGIYTLSYQPGSSIENNRIEALYPPQYATNLRGFYIYLDEATDGYLIRNNWCPEAKFGDNRPGPDVRWENNGPSAKH